MHDCFVGEGVMDGRDFAWVDLAAFTLIFLVVATYFHKQFGEHRCSIEQFFFGTIWAFVVLVVTFSVFSFWGMVTTITPVACALNLPNGADIRSPKIENNTMYCESGFELKEGRRSSVYCRKEIKRDCGR